MNEKICCVTGHRDIPKDKLEYVKERLREEIKAAIADGCTTFISGFSEGADLLFAELVAEQREEHPGLFLEAALPYRGILHTKDPVFRRLLPLCGGIKIQQQEYSKDCFLNRNRYMISNAARVIAVYDGREQGGTYSALCYAGFLEKEIREIRI